MAQKKLPILMFFLILPFLEVSNQDRCCRSDFEKVPFEYLADLAHRPVPQGSCALYRIENTRHNLTITLAVESGVNLPTSFVSSNDLGGTWEKAFNESPSTIVKPHVEFIQSPSDEKVLYKIVSSEGVYQISRDRGQNWASPKYLIEGMTLSQFARKHGGAAAKFSMFVLAGIHPTKPETLFGYFQLRDTRAALFVEVGKLYVSEDSGDHWKEYAADFIFGSPLGISPADPNVRMGFRVGGIFASSDGGRQWKPVGQNRALVSRPTYRHESSFGKTMLGAPASIEVKQIVFDPKDTQRVFLVTNKGVFLTTNAGTNWCLVNLGSDELDSVHNLSQNPQNPLQVFVATRYGLFASEDGGCHWKKIYEGKTASSIISGAPEHPTLGSRLQD